MYLRAVRNLEDWDKSSVIDLESLPITCLYSYAEEKNDEYSLYKINSTDDVVGLRSIAVKLFSSSPTKWFSGFHLMIISDDLVKVLPSIEDDKDKHMGCLHANIVDATYRTFKKLVEYTYEKYNDNPEKYFIEYSFEKMADLFAHMEVEEFDYYVKEYSKDSKEQAKFKTRVKEKFFNGSSVELPKYLRKI